MFGANVTTPVASILNGPVVTGVTSVLLAVTGTPFKVSFVVTLPTVVGTVVPGVWLGKVSATASIIGAVTAKLVWELSFEVLAFP